MTDIQSPTAPRIGYETTRKHAPKLASALVELGAASTSDLEASLVHLVKLRASQINGCAFCVNMHAEEARHDGETEPRLQLVSVWQEAPVFTERERSALAWTEALTKLPEGVSDALFEEVSRWFTEAELIFLTGTIATINAWNRFGAAFRYTPVIKHAA